MKKESLRAIESANIGAILTTEEMGFIKGGTSSKGSGKGKGKSGKGKGKSGKGKGKSGKGGNGGHGGGYNCW